MNWNLFPIGFGEITVNCHLCKFLISTWSEQRLAFDGKGRVRLENVSNVLDSFPQTIHFTVDMNKP